MAVLIVYCMKSIWTDPQTSALPNLAAAALVAVSYKWKHNTFLSILLGTVCYMVLLRIFQFAHKKWLKIRGCNHRLTNCPCGFLVCNGENSYDKNIKYAMWMAGGGAYDISG